MTRNLVVLRRFSSFGLKKSEEMSNVAGMLPGTSPSPLMKRNPSLCVADEESRSEEPEQATQSQRHLSVSNAASQNTPKSEPIRGRVRIEDDNAPLDLPKLDFCRDESAGSVSLVLPVGTFTRDTPGGVIPMTILGRNISADPSIAIALDDDELEEVSCMPSFQRGVSLDSAKVIGLFGRRHHQTNSQNKAKKLNLINDDDDEESLDGSLGYAAIQFGKRFSTPWERSGKYSLGQSKSGLEGHVNVAELKKGGRRTRRYFQIG